MIANPSSGSSDRLMTLDVVRGFAILGIFVVHVSTLGLTPLDFQAPNFADDVGVFSYTAWFVMVAFFELKFWALFALLFGVGIVLQSDAAEAKSRPFLGFFTRRLLLLGFFGILHGLVLFPYEVLLVYAGAGFLFLPFRRMRARTHVILCGVFLVGLAVWGEVLTGFDSGDDEEAGGESVSLTTEEVAGLSLLEIIDVLAEGAKEDSHVLALAERELGSLGVTFRVRGASYIVWLLICVFFLGWRAFAMFFLGAALYRLGFFAREGVNLRRRLRVAGILLGLPLEVAYALSFRLGSESVQSLLLGIHFTSSALLALAYASILIDLVHANRFAALMTRLSLVGRSALSNYVLQSLILNLLFGWWALNLWLSFPVALLLSVVIFGFQVLISRWWFRSHGMGPLEWLWRCGSYLQWFPWKNPVTVHDDVEKKA